MFNYNNRLPGNGREPALIFFKCGIGEGKTTAWDLIHRRLLQIFAENLIEIKVKIQALFRYNIGPPILPEEEAHEVLDLFET